MPWGRRVADVVLFGVTAVELALLFRLTNSFGIADWIYVAQHLLVLVVALVRRAPDALDRSLSSAAMAGVAYAYPYALVILLRWSPGETACPRVGLMLVTIAAVLSFASLATLGRRFGVRPALRGLVTRGPYALVRHPMYLSYLIADIGYALQEWKPASLLIIAIGWCSLVYRIGAEERILAAHPSWPDYAARVRSRLIPVVW